MPLILAFLILAISAVPASVYLAIPAFFSFMAATSKTNTSLLKVNRTIALLLAIILSTWLISLVSISSIQGIALSLRGAARPLLYIFLLIAIFKIPTHQLRQTFKFLLMVLIAALPLQSHLSLTEGIGGSQRYQFIFEHPNHFAYFLIPVLIYFLALEENQRIKVLGILVTLISLALAKSSGALVTAMLIIALNYLKGTKALIYGALVGSICVVAVLTTGVFDKILEQATSFDPSAISSKINDENFGGSGSLSWRFVYWGSIWKSFTQEAWYTIIFGLGYGSMTFGSYAYDFMYTDPHNDYLKILVENGLLGLSILGYVILMLAKLRTKYRWLIFTAAVVPMFFGNILVNPAFITALGIVIAISLKTKEERKIKC
jgi:O-antigen ligase